MKVLIVEDEMIIAMRLEQFIMELGHQVCGLASTEEGAITSAATYRPDVVLMDLRLAHGGSGTEAACQIYKTLGIRSIVVSANIDATAREALQGCEPIAFVAKPFQQTELDNALRTIIPRYIAPRETMPEYVERSKKLYRYAARVIAAPSPFR
jgi:two-component system, response regulator PdtaR